MSGFNNSEVKDNVSIVPNAKGTPDCRLISIEAISSKPEDAKQWKAIEFTVKEIKTGAENKDRIFNPEDKSASPPYPDYSYETERNKIMSRIKHYQGRFMEQAVVDATQGADWDSYVKNIINSFPAGYKEIPCSIQFCYIQGKDKDGKIAYYPNLRKYPPFISTEKFPVSFSTKLYKNEFFEYPSKTTSSTPAEPNGGGAVADAGAEI